jgi:hypothetical protein
VPGDAIEPEGIQCTRRGNSSNDATYSMADVVFVGYTLTDAAEPLVAECGASQIMMGDRLSLSVDRYSRGTHSRHTELE